MSGMVARLYMGMARGVSLCGALLRQNDISISKEFSGTFVHVDEYGGNGWAEAPDVVQCNLMHPEYQELQWIEQLWQ